MQIFKTGVLACAVSLAALSSAGAATLSTGTGDGSVTVDVSLYGSFGSSANRGPTYEGAGLAVFDPVGGIGPASTVFESFVYFLYGPTRTPTDGLVTMPATIVSQSDTQLITSFSIGLLNVQLTQRLLESLDGDAPVGAALSQEFRITNADVALHRFDIVRYIDGDLGFDGSISDSGGIMGVGANQILFETDSASADDPGRTFLGITTSVGGANDTTLLPPRNYQISQYSGLRSTIQAGGPLANVIQGDTDGDGFINGSYDVTMAFQDFVAIPAGGTLIYTTTTLWGNAVLPTPGSSAALPLLPDRIGPAGGFEFDIPATMFADGATVWIDPPVAVGYTYTVTGGEFASVELPGLGIVPDADGAYVVTVGSESFDVTAGSVFDFLLAGLTGVTEFTITGIDLGLALDPADPTAFPVGISLIGITADTILITQTPITHDPGPAPIPLPASALLLGAGLGALGLLRRRRRA